MTSANTTTNPETDHVLEHVRRALEGVRDVAAVVLGGSRARGTAGSGSDYDVGLYYDGAASLDLDALRSAAQAMVDPGTSAALTDIGGWVRGSMAAGGCASPGISSIFCTGIFGWYAMWSRRRRAAT